MVRMEVSLKNIGKRYNYNWVFRNIDHAFSQNNAYAITGPNGAGKSTLLQIIGSNLSPSEGEAKYVLAGKNIPVEEVPSYISFAAPYHELIEEFTLNELLHFHVKFKKLLPEWSPLKIIRALNFEKEKDKHIKNFSSGMRQRVKLALAVLSDTRVVLLDEPTTNLDEEGAEWYLNLINDHKNGRLLIISSNNEREYQFCSEHIALNNFKR